MAIVCLRQTLEHSLHQTARNKCSTRRFSRDIYPIQQMLQVLDPNLILAALSLKELTQF